MPQCQFPIFCCFCVSEKLYRKYSRNWTKWNPNLLFFPDTWRRPKESRRGAREQPHQGVARPPPPGHARGWCGPPGRPLMPALRLFKASISETLNQSVFFEKEFYSSSATTDEFRGTEVSVLAPSRDGEVPSEPSPSMPSPPPSSPSTSPPSPPTLLSPMMRREYFSPGAEGSTSSYVVHLSLPWYDLYVIMSFVSSWIDRCYSSYIMLLSCFIIVISGDTLYCDVKVTVCTLCVSFWLVSLWIVGVCWNHLVCSRW
jgi:hypothetical protein